MQPEFKLRNLNILLSCMAWIQSEDSFFVWLGYQIFHICRNIYHLQKRRIKFFLCMVPFSRASPGCDTEGDSGQWNIKYLLSVVEKYSVYSRLIWCVHDLSCALWQKSIYMTVDSSVNSQCESGYATPQQSILLLTVEKVMSTTVR